MKPYSVLAKYYDKLSENDCDYVRWSQYLCATAKYYGARTVADIACGTGKMTKLLREKGFDVLGVDDSPEMLNQAVENCRGAVFARQNMKNLCLPRPVDMAICVNDGVNYLKNTELVEFFRAVARNLKDGAPFVFDVSSPYKLQNVLGNNVFYVDETDETLLWTNQADSEKVVMSLTLFERRGQSYTRFDETHIQYIHSEQSLAEALENAGFLLREVSADYGQPVGPNSLRLTFYAEKSHKN